MCRCTCMINFFRTATSFLTPKRPEHSTTRLYTTYFVYQILCKLQRFLQQLEHVGHPGYLGFNLKQANPFVQSKTRKNELRRKSGSYCEVNIIKGDKIWWIEHIADLVDINFSITFRAVVFPTFQICSKVTTINSAFQNDASSLTLKTVDRLWLHPPTHTIYIAGLIPKHLACYN